MVYLGFRHIVTYGVHGKGSGSLDRDYFGRYKSTEEVSRRQSTCPNRLEKTGKTEYFKVSLENSSRMLTHHPAPTP
jgi:hypothetical protein